MKFKFICFVVASFLFFSCSLENDANEPVPTKTLYHLVNVKGGIAGVDEDFEVNTIVWFFDTTTSTLEIDNNNSDSTKPDGLDTGDYSYSIIEANAKEYLVVDDNEIGSIYFDNSFLIIDENDLSNGTGADGFTYTFAVQIVAE